MTGPDIGTHWCRFGRVKIMAHQTKRIVRRYFFWALSGISASLGLLGFVITSIVVGREFDGVSAAWVLSTCCWMLLANSKAKYYVHCLEFPFRVTRLR